MDSARHPSRAHPAGPPEGAERTIPLWPQLREILEEYLATYRQNLLGQVLFPSPHVQADRPLTDLRDLLDRVAIRAGFLIDVPSVLDALGGIKLAVQAFTKDVAKLSCCAA